MVANVVIDKYYLERDRFRWKKTKMVLRSIRFRSNKTYLIYTIKCSVTIIRTVKDIINV